MNKEYIYSNLCNMIDKIDILLDEPMKNHTSFKVGGPADFLIMPRTENQIRDIVNFAKDNKIPYFLMGNGSNILVKDKGIRGIVVKIGENFNKFSIKDNVVIAQSGILLSKLAKNIINESLKGFEFASGIPGSIGGAVAMNAGAYGGEMKDIIHSVRVLSEDGNIYTLSNEEMKFSYRKSIISNTTMIVLEIKMILDRGNYDDIKLIVDDYTMRRTTKQPLHLPSAGSTFKRPTGYFAGKLIEDSDLKGLSLRGAKVSEKHCGFVVNSGKASATDVLDLLELIKKTVYDRFNIILEEEVKIVGED